MSTKSEEPAPRPAPQHLPFLTLVLLLLIALHAFHGPIRSWVSGRYRAVHSFRRAFDICLDEYVEPRPTDELVHGAIDGMVKTLNDPHSAFLSPVDNRRQQEIESGRYGGLGVYIRLADGKLLIQQVFAASPAFDAGLRAGDIIVSAAEHDPDGLREPVKRDLTGITSVSKASTFLKGKPGTKVTLGILRNGKSLEITVERWEIEPPIVEHRVLADGIGYLRIRGFPNQVSRKAQDKLAELREKRIRGLVIDVRGNRGGFLDEAVRVADLFIAGGIVVSTRNRNQDENKVFRATAGGPAEALPLVVLIDAGSASAAEVVAGALQDHGRARLVGIKTYGKGAVSKRFPLKDDSGILLSTGRYLLPGGRQIEGEGLTPDLEVQPPTREELKKVEPGTQPPDPQLDAAAKLLRDQLAASN